MDGDTGCLGLGKEGAGAFQAADLYVNTLVFQERRDPREVAFGSAYTKATDDVENAHVTTPPAVLTRRVASRQLY